MTSPVSHQAMPSSPMFLYAPNIPVPHAFTTRTGGISPAPFASLNLGLSSGDTPVNVEHNRDIALAAFGSDRTACCAFHQIHSDRVIVGKPTLFTEEADASITDDPTLTLVISTADCLPILFYDTQTPAIGVAHCGWRGTVQGLASRVVSAMQDHYGTHPANLHVAIGPGISQAHYQVGQEVIDAFDRAKFPADVYQPDPPAHSATVHSTTVPSAVTPDTTPRYRLNLAHANRFQLERCGVTNIWQSPYCTYQHANLFYSYRRDAGQTGRHWSLLKLA